MFSVSFAGGPNPQRGFKSVSEFGLAGDPHFFLREYTEANSHGKDVNNSHTVYRALNR